MCIDVECDKRLYRCAVCLGMWIFQTYFTVFASDMCIAVEFDERLYECAVRTLECDERLYVCAVCDVMCD